MSLKVTIICTVYNHEDYLESTLQGFVNQKTNFDYEVIIHDDASTDQSASIIKKYEYQYPNIIKPIYQKENQYSQGISIFKTIIYPKVKGEYIAYCEGDDYWIDEYKLQKQVDFLDENLDYSACVHNYQKLNCKTGKLITMHPKKDKDITLVDSFNGTMANYQTATLMHRYKYGDRNSELFNIYTSIGDNPLTVYLALNGKIRFLGDVMSVYRYGSTGSWSVRNLNNSIFKINFQKENIEFYKCIKKLVDSQYHETLNNKILEAQYNIEYLNGNIKQLKSAPLNKVYQNKSIKEKMKVNLYPLYKNVIGIIKGKVKF